MIVRAALACATCDAPHTVRIGMGQEEKQLHKFSCRKCGEEIVVGLEVDYKNIRHRVLYEENANPIREVDGAPIVNLDANFLIPEGEQGRDRVFPRITQAQQLLDASPANRSVALPNSHKKSEQRPFRRPDYAGEWQQLRKAWSLHRNNREKLSKKRIQAASRTFYRDEPLTDLADWLWRFTLFMCQPAYEPLLRGAMDTIKPLLGSEGLKEFAKHYNRNMAGLRAPRYFNLMKDYFSAYSEFGQVHFLVARSVTFPADYRASSTDFDHTKMFYGNAFEAFATLVDVLALLNNLLCGRPFDKFDQMTLAQYEKLDKVNRFNAFSMNAAFTSLCREADNKIRNASHHGSMQFDPSRQLILYQTGKGGTGPAQQIGYTDYLERCVRIFLQGMTLLRVELILANQLGIQYPL